MITGMKGRKFDEGYASSASGMKYREIAEFMTAQGDKMNTATARHIFIKGMEKFAIQISKQLELGLDVYDIDKLAKSALLQNALSEIISNNPELM